MLLAGDINKTQAKRFLKELEQDEGRSLNYTIMTYEDFYYRLSIKDQFIASITNGKFTLLQDTEGILTNH